MKLLVLSLGLMALSGCATILNDDTQGINISSNKEDISGNISGVSFKGAGVVTVPRTKADKVIKIDTKGCPSEMVVASEVDPKFFINILSGGTFGSTTDYATEKMWKYQENVNISCN